MSMDKLQLTIVMPTEKVFEGEAERVMVRTMEGEVAILPRHIDYAAALGSGEARITAGGVTRRAQIHGGRMHVSQNCVRILTTDFSWLE